MLLLPYLEAEIDRDAIYLVAGITLPSLLILPGCSNAVCKLRAFRSTVQTIAEKDAIVHDVGKLS